VKPFAAQSYYELLEISASASAAEVRGAWQRLTRMYADDQLALYGLATPETAAALRKRLLEAMEVLSDDELRSMYDEELGLPPRDPAREEPEASQLEMGELLRGADHSVASTHPRVAFTWSEPAGPPVAPPPPPGFVPPSTGAATPRPSPSAPAAELPVPVAAPFSPVAELPVPVAAPSAPVAAPSAPVAELPVPVAELPVPVAAPSAPVAAPPRAAEAERLSEEHALSMLPRASPVPAPAPRASAPPPAAPERPRMPELAPDTEYNGELLRKVRTALGLSLAEVAERTRIGAKHLENVEADRYDQLPATVYLRGILMSLAKELRLDGLKVARSYLLLVERIRSKG